MRFLVLALVIIAGILGAVVLIQKGQERIVAETAPPATAAAQVGPDTPATLPTPATPPPMERLARNPDAASAPAQTGSAQAGPAPASPAQVSPAQASPAQPGPAQTAAQAAPAPKKQPDPPVPAFQVLAKPAIVTAGLLETTRGRVALKDIVAVDPGSLCGTGASAWPCGQLAATQLRRFLRGRSVNCDIADPGWEGAVTARCMLGKEDVAGWLVENGWARAIPGSAYEEAGRAAEAGKLGIFGPDPRHP